jgi:hypothetical protein
MKKSSKVIWAILAVLLVFSLFFSIYLIQKKRDARPFNTYDFPSTLVVENATEYDRADTLCLYLAHQILGLDTINLILVYIPEHINDGETEFYGIIQYLPFRPNQFLILLNKNNLSLGKLKETLAHEFVHVDQYLRGDLQIYPLYAVWKGEEISFLETKYEDRPFEKEAFANQGSFVRKLNKFLYD